MGNGWRIALAVVSALALLVSGTAIGMALMGSQIWSSNWANSRFGEGIGLSDWDSSARWMARPHGMLGVVVAKEASATDAGESLSLDEALTLAEAYLGQYWGDSLQISEVMEFDNHFYAEAIEVDTEIHAFEILIDPYSGAIHPEPGPNMMWNTKYGMMATSGGMGRHYGMMRSFRANSADEMSVSPERAHQLAQGFLDRTSPGITVDTDVDTFYGYYTIHTLQDGQIVGMLSVHGETGQIWPHTWHGEFIAMMENAHE